MNAIKECRRGGRVLQQNITLQTTNQNREKRRGKVRENAGAIRSQEVSRNQMYYSPDSIQNRDIDIPKEKEYFVTKTEDKRQLVQSKEEEEWGFSTEVIIPQILSEPRNKDKNSRISEIGKIVRQSSKGRSLNQSQHQNRNKEEQQKIRKNKLEDLTQKRKKLLERLKLVEQQRTKKIITQPLDPSSLFAPLKRYFQRNSRYLPSSLQFDSFHSPSLSRSFTANHSMKLPTSMQSAQKNRKVLNFIKKMHGQSIERDLVRLEKYHQSRLKILREEYDSLAGVGAAVEGQEWEDKESKDDKKKRADRIRGSGSGSLSTNYRSIYS